MKNLIRPAVALFLLLSVVVGIVYPVVTFGIGTLLFPNQVAGSLIQHDHHIAGSTLIGQQFTSPRYFWGRPSATGPMPYNGLNSGGSNYGPSNPAQKSAVADRVKAIHDADPDNRLDIPIDLVTASASGLDPEISPAGALYQVQRVARLRNLNPVTVRHLVEDHIRQPQWGMFGEARVNVLELNIAIDSLAK
jgi:K+-transporting ATPase ATPase C chain